MAQRSLKPVALLCFASGLCSSAPAQTTFPEAPEPNNNKTTASGPFVMSPGDVLSGSGNQFTDGVDYWLIETEAAPPGIYEYKLVRNGTDGTIQIRGLTQSNGTVTPSSDTLLQVIAPSNTVVHWYGFGRGERLFSSINGASGNYTATLSRNTITPQDLGVFSGGLMTITSLGATTVNAEVWVYDADLRPIPGFNNDDEPAPGTTSSAKLMRDFIEPGPYYLAISRSNLANNLPASLDDRNRSGRVADFPDFLLSSTGSPTTVSCDFWVVDGAGADTYVITGQPFASPNNAPVLWYTFQVTPPAVTGACCLPDGTCKQGTAAGCPAEGGSYAGDGMACAACDLAPACYANCDESTTAPVLNVGDFTCFLQRFAAGESYANCDESTTVPILNVGDFTCFLQKFAAGCP